MDEFIQQYEQYSQFIVMALIFLVGAAYFIYTYYKKQEDIKKVNANIHQAQQQQNKQPDFFPTDTFKGYNQGYIFKKDNKGIGYYMDK